MIALPLGEYGDGRHVGAWVPVPAGSHHALAVVQRCTGATPDLWPRADTLIDLLLEMSLDGGVTVHPNTEICSPKIPGGVTKLKGAHYPVTRYGYWSLSPEIGGAACVRVIVAVCNGPWKSQAELHIA